VIPEGAKDLGFLEGCWKVDTVNSEHTGFPFYYVHCFDSRGHASMRAYATINGRQYTCHGTASARLAAGGRLTIDTSDAPCPGSGYSIYPRTLRCAPRSGGAAACTLTHTQGITHSTRIVRQ
jgi:hypothetical protein